MAGTAGSVAPVFRDGGYDDTVIYDFYHALIHNNKLYFCRQDGTIGHEPQEESDEYWFLSLDGTFADAASLGGETALQWQRKINVEKARIDQLIAMEEESIVTDIEKELADIRVGSNGVTYEDAGTAVREQMAVRNVATRKVSEIPDVKLPLDEVLEEIDAKTDEAFKAMEEKAKETIESIPADYTALSNDVTGIKSDLSQFESELIYTEKSTNIFDKNSMVTVGSWWKYNVAVGSKVELESNNATTNYGAIRITLDNTIEAVTIGAEDSASSLFNYYFVDGNDIVITNSGVINQVFDKDGYTISNVANAKYLLVNISDYTLYNTENKLQVNTGSELQPYDDYKNNKYIAEDRLEKKPRNTMYITTDTHDSYLLLQMLKALEIGNTDVIFERGIYTVCSAYEYMRDTLGWGYARGLPVGNGCRYFFNGSTIISEAPDNYSDTRNVLDNILGDSNFEIYDCTLINNGGTYCIHDEGNSCETPYFHKYSNVKMIKNGGTGSAFGCGTGFDASLTFDSCLFINNNLDLPPFSIHASTTNPENLGNKLHLTMNNCYFNIYSIDWNLFDSERDTLDIYLFGNKWRVDFASNKPYVISNNNTVF